MGKVCTLPKGMEMYRAEINKNAAKYAENGHIKAAEAELQRLQDMRSKVEQAIAKAFPKPEAKEPAKPDVVSDAVLKKYEGVIDVTQMPRIDLLNNAKTALDALRHLKLYAREQWQKDLATKLIANTDLNLADVGFNMFDVGQIAGTRWAVPLDPNTYGVALYNEQTGNTEVGLRRAQASEEVILHEILHAVTNGALQTDAAFSKEVDSIRKAFNAALLTLPYYKDSPITKDQANQLTSLLYNPKEFMSAFFSNAGIRDLSRRMAADGRLWQETTTPITNEQKSTKSLYQIRARLGEYGLFDRIMDAIRKVLGKTTKLSEIKAIEDAIDKANDFNKANQPYRKSLQAQMDELLKRAGKQYGKAKTPTGPASVTASPIRAPTTAAPIHNAYEKAAAARVYGGRDSKGVIAMFQPNPAPTARVVKGALENALDTTKGFVKSKFLPLNTMLDKSYFGRAVKHMFLNMSATIGTYHTWLSNELETKVAPYTSNKKVKHAADNMMSAISAAMSSNLNNPKIRAEVERIIDEEIGLQTWIGSVGNDSTKVVQLMEQNPAAMEKLWNLLSKDVDFKNGLVKVDYWRMAPETVDQVAERKARRAKGDKSAVRQLVIANTETYKAFEGLTPEEAKSVEKVVRAFFEMNAKMQLTKAASRQYSLDDTINQSVSRMLVVPYGLDMATAQSHLGDLYLTYLQLVNDPNAKKEAANFRNAVMVMLNTGKFDNTGKNQSQTFDDTDLNIRSKIAELHAAIKRNPDKKAMERFAVNVSDIFDKTMAISKESPLINESLVTSIGGFYIPQQRESKYRVRLVPKDANGNIVALDRSEYGRMMMSMDSETEANVFVEEFNNDGSSKQEFEVIDSSGEVKKVHLEAESMISLIKDTAATEANVSLRQLFSSLETAGIRLNQKQMENLIRGQAGRSSAALRNLNRKFAYGADTNASNLLARNLNNIAYQIGDNVHGSAIDAMTTNAFGWTKQNLQIMLDQTQRSIKMLEASSDPAAKNRLIFEYEARDNLKAGLKMHDDGQAGDTKNLLRSARAAVQQEAQGDPDVTDYLRKWTAITQLGLSFSNFITNIAGGVPSTIAYLGGKRTTAGKYLGGKEGFGGGYGYDKAAFAMYKAVRDVISTTGLNIFRKDVGAAQVEAYAKNLPAGLEKEIWTRVAREMTEGRLQVGAAMSMTQLAKETPGIGSDARSQANRIGELMMRPFTASEGIIRIATFVAAARLEAAKQLKGGKFSEVANNSAKYKVFMDKITDAGNDAIENTQGIYDHWAKGQYMRTGVSGILTQFKHYPAVQLTLLANMDNKSRLMYMALLGLMAGVDGWPGAEDAKELYNILAKMFPSTFAHLGLDSRKMANQVYRAIEDTSGIPHDALKHGLVSYLTGADFTGSLGMGSILPLKSVYDKNGLQEALGPVGSFVFNSLDSGSALLSAAGATMRGDYNIAAERVFEAGKTAPIKVVKNVTGAFDIADDGVSSTRNGLVVARNLDAIDAMMKGLGWRPMEEAGAYEAADIIKNVKELRTNIQRDFNNLMVIAELEKNPELKREALAAYRALNAKLKESGAPFSLTYDPAVVARLAKEGTKGVAERMGAKVPKDMQRFVEETIAEGEDDAENEK